MKITHAISLDFQRYRTPSQIDVVQDDTYSRYVAVSLFDNMTAWVVPESVTVAVRFKKPDRTQGVYDTLPDGTTAYSIDSNTVTVGVAPQMLTAKGKVTASVVMYLGTVQLATFPFVLNVVENPAAGQSISNDYYYLQTWDDVNAAIGNLADLETEDQSSLIAAINEVAKRTSEACLPLAGGTMTGKIVFPTGDTNVGITNSEDQKIVGYGNDYFRVGDPQMPVQLRGSGSNPMFNGEKILVEGDITDGLLTVETITVGEDTEETVAVTGLTLDLTSYNAKVGGAFYINPVVLPTNATNKVVTWKSSATSIVTVDGNGYVECIAAGDAVITCTTADGGFTATCTVNVATVDSDETEVTLSSISATYSGGDVAVGTVVTDLTGIVVTAHYSDGSSETVTGYTLSGTIAEGSNTVTVSYGGKTTTFTVTGVAESTDGKIQYSTLERTEGGIKGDGTAHTLSNTYHAVIPYTEGMYIRTIWKRAWSAATYPPILVVAGDTYSIPDYAYMTDENGEFKTAGLSTGTLGNIAEATLSGYATDSNVIINMLLLGSATDEQLNGLDSLYYIPGGDS